MPDSETIVMPDRVVPPLPAEKWFALHVKSRHEKIVSAFLQGKGLEDFVPLYRARRRWSDRIKFVETPLFPGYVFCRFDPEDRLPVLVTPGVVQIVGSGGVPIPVADEEIAAVQAIIASGLPAEPWPYLKAGHRVRIDFGALSGLEGILLDLKSRHRLVVSVTLLQRSVSVEIDRAWVVPLKTYAAG